MSYRLKYDRAMQHLNAIEAALDDWIQNSGHTYPQEADADSGQVIVRIRFGAAPKIDEWGVAIGDCLQNMRSSLDHLAFALAERHSGIPLADKLADGSEFPIFGTRPPTARELENKVGGIAPAARTIIEGLQPARLGAGYEGDPLWGLHRLANMDKHRTIHVGIFAQQGGGIGGFNWKLSDAHWAARPLEDGAEIARFRVEPSDPSQPMQVYFLFPLYVSFPEGAPAYGNPVVPLLRHFSAYIEREVFTPLALFL